MGSESYIIRPAADGDWKFISAAWATSWRPSPWAGCIPADQAFAVTDAVIANLRARGLETFVAVSPTADWHILGFAAGLGGPETPVLHFAYVKAPFRRERVATALLARLGITKGQPFLYTHRTRHSKYLGGTWCPALARVTPEE